MRKLLLPLLLFALLPFAAAGTPQLSVEVGNDQVCPTDSGKYKLEISNPGPAADSYQLRVDAPWQDAATLSSASVEDVPPGESRDVFLWIQAPKGASRGDHGFTVTATSSNTGEVARDGGEVTVLSCREVSIDATPQARNVCRGAEAVYRFRVENDGTVEETYRLSSDFSFLSQDRVTLEPGEERTVKLIASSRTELNRSIQVRAESTSSYASDTATVGFTARTCRDVAVTVEPQTATVCRSDSLPLTISLTNRGSIPDTYDLSFDGTSLNATAEPGQTVTVERTIPAARIEGDLTITAQSRSLSTVEDTTRAAVSVEPCYDGELTAERLAPETANRTLVELSLNNNGTRENTYTFQIDGPDWMDVRPERLTLGPGERAPIYVYIAPDFFGDGTYTAVLVGNGTATRRTVDITVTAENGTITGVDAAITRTPTGLIARASSTVTAVVLTALVLLAGGYYLFYRERETAAKDS